MLRSFLLGSGTTAKHVSKETIRIHNWIYLTGGSSDFCVQLLANESICLLARTWPAGTRWTGKAVGWPCLVASLRSTVQSGLVVYRPSLKTGLATN